MAKNRTQLQKIKKNKSTKLDQFKKRMTMKQNSIFGRTI